MPFGRSSRLLFSRYWLPVVPALLPLAALPVAVLGREGGRRAKMGLALACLAAWGLPHLLRFSPRMDLGHCNLGRLAEEAARPDEAASHYQEVLAVNPDDFLANLNLGSYATRHGRMDAALALLTAPPRSSRPPTTPRPTWGALSSSSGG